MPPARVNANTVSSDGLWQRPSTDKAPRLQVHKTSYGFRYAAIRRPIFNAQSHDYVRITSFIAPYTVLVPPNNLYSLVNINVPQDDTNTMFHFIAWSDGEGIDQDKWRKLCAATPGVDLNPDWSKKRTVDNRFLQDRQAMKLGDFSGIKGIPNQDMAMWETMGPIADRSKERLGASDVAIVQFRQQMVDAVKHFIATGEALGAGAGQISHDKLRSYEGVVPKSTNWRELGAAKK
jgi:phthalate 4,5-dioxygenase oxygenase subunit